MQNVNNEKLAININLNLKVVKDIKKADMTFSIAKDAKEAVYFIDNIKDINTTYPYSQKKAREIIQNKLVKQKIQCELHQSNFNLICDKYNLKQNEDYFYYHNIANRYSCSNKLIDFVYNLILQNPNIINDIKEEFKYKKT